MTARAGFPSGRRRMRPDPAGLPSAMSAVGGSAPEPEPGPAPPAAAGPAPAAPLPHPPPGAEAAKGSPAQGGGAAAAGGGGGGAGAPSARGPPRRRLRLLRRQRGQRGVRAARRSAQRGRQDRRRRRLLRRLLRRRLARRLQRAPGGLPPAAGGLHPHDPGRRDRLLPQPRRLRGRRPPHHPTGFLGCAEVRLGHCQRCAAALQDEGHGLRELPQQGQRQEVHSVHGRPGPSPGRVRHQRQEAPLLHLGPEPQRPLWESLLLLGAVTLEHFLGTMWVTHPLSGCC